MHYKIVFFKLQVYTDVVNRKTTITTFPDITFYDLINSDSENSENMARNKRAKSRKGRTNVKRNDVKPKIRKCDECHSIVPSGTDMYRFHRTRLTVCRNCWVTMDPSNDKLKRRSRQIESNLAETKLCTVFLTDVLDKNSYKNKKEYKIGKNKNNESYDTSSAHDDISLKDRLFESSSNFVSKSENNAINNNTKQGKKQQNDIEKNEDIESTPIKITRLSKKRTNANESKVLSDVEQQSPMMRQGRKRTAISDQSSDSDVSSLKSKEKSDDHAKNLSPSSSKPDRKKLRTILEGVTGNVRSETTNESSIEDMNLKSTTKDALNARINKEKNIRKRTRSSSISSTEMTLEEFKSSKSKTSSEIKKNSHTCDTCGKKFDTKLENVKHSLTHFMQASLKLERVTVPSIKKMKIDSEEDKISYEAQVCSPKTISINKHIDDLSEEIAVNVVDTDDEEIFSLPKKQNENNKEAEKEANSKDCNVTDKLDTESELCTEESTKIQSDEKITEESEQSAESTAVPNETVISIAIEQSKDIKETNTKNKDIRDEDTTNINTKDKDRKTSMDRDTDASRDEDTNVQKDAGIEDTSSTSKPLYCNELCTSVDAENNKDVTAKNDTKVSITEKEKSNDEVSDNKEHFHEEKMHDSNVTKPLVSSINNTIKDNKNHNENCKSDVKNSSKDNESEIIRDTEIKQSNLTNKSGKENVNESEEKEKNVSSIIDETETLKNQIDLGDTVIVDENKVETSEKQQDVTNEQNMELDIIVDVDKLNSATDTVKLDLLNDEKLNQTEDGDEDESDVAIMTANSNNDIQYAKITEETITVDSSKEKDKLEETIKNLEELIENNTTTNNKCKEQENSNQSKPEQEISNDNSMDAASMILEEVFDLAAAEVKKREDVNNTKSLQDTDLETLENITREIRNSADMPSLDPISIMDIDDDNDITLN